MSTIIPHLPFFDLFSVESFVNTFFRSDEHNQDLLNKSKEQRRGAHAYIIAQLAEEGWEPAGTNDEGLITVMQRVHHERL